SALVAESVERLAVRVLGRGGIVLPLIEKRPGLLPFQPVVVKPNTVHAVFGRTLCSPKQPRLPWRQLFQLTNASIDALDNSRRLRFFEHILNQRSHDSIAHG